MAIVVNTPNMHDQSVYIHGHTHSISDQGDLTITNEAGTIIAAHNRSQWTSVQYGTINPQPEPQDGETNTEKD